MFLMELFSGGLTPAKASIIQGGLASAVVILGWFVIEQFNRKARMTANERADRIKVLEILLNKTELQIKEFYGPIYSLIEHIETLWETQEKFRNEFRPGELNREQILNEIVDYINQNYFKALHNEIQTILKNKLHLLEGCHIPDSFLNYLKHSMLQNIQYRLWTEQEIDTLCVAGFPWPGQFSYDIRQGLQNALTRYEKYLIELQGNPTNDKHIVPIVSNGISERRTLTKSELKRLSLFNRYASSEHRSLEEV